MNARVEISQLCGVHIAVLSDARQRRKEQSVSYGRIGIRVTEDSLRV